MTIRKLTLSMMTAGLLSFSVGAFAQEYSREYSPTDTPPTAPGTVEVSEYDLKKFAKAQTAISEIQQDFAGRLQGVDDPSEAHELQTKANEEMVEAVEEVGLDVESFNQIAMSIQNDPALQQRLNELLQERS